MISQFFKDIEQKYKGYTIRIHNFSKFDSLYMLKILYKMYKIGALFKDGKVISLNLSSKNKNKKENKLKLFIKDSLKLLPLSLENLVRGFNIDTKKLLFPYRFVNKDNLNYTGPIPIFDYYTDDGLCDKSKHDRYLELVKEFENKP
jgi:DNA polymerase type B, organellar and viral